MIDPILQRLLDSRAPFRGLRAPRGPRLNCRSWAAEAPLRMLLNNLDPEVAELPEQLIVYGGSGKAARTWEALVAIARHLLHLEEDQTLLIQSGKPVGILPTHPEAPRVLIANSLLVPHWANWDVFRQLEAKGLIMYGQMTAGSWIYIGTQGILQGTYETFAALAARHYGAGADLRGKIVLSAGLGGMGGAQPLAVTMNGGVFIGVEVDRDRIQKRLDTGYLDTYTDSLKEAVAQARHYAERGVARSIGLLANAADIYPQVLASDFLPDVVTDQTSAHDPVGGYIPQGLTVGEAAELRVADPRTYEERALASIKVHLEAMIGLQRRGAVVFDYGNNIRGQGARAGVEDAFAFPGFVPAYIRPLFCEGKGPFRWAALSGNPADIHRTDELILEHFSEDKALCRWIELAREKVHFQGLPARICWLGQGARAKMGRLINDEVAASRIEAPIVIGRDHLDTGSVASPYRETEDMRDGSDAIADWPILNALVNAVSGATWVSVHHGGGVGIGYSLHAGQVVMADGTEAAARRLARVLHNDPAMGVIRHADAGYEQALATARAQGIATPLVPTREGA